MESEFWSAIMGAVVGGAIALAIQLLVLSDTRRDRKRQADELKEAIAFSLFLKLQSCSNDLTSFAQHVIEGRAKAQHRRWELWNAMTPIPNLPRHQEFTNDEFVLLLRERKFALFNDVRDVASVHHASINSFKLYLELRSELGRATGADMQGSIGKVELDAQQMTAVGPLMSDVRGLADSLADMVISASAEAKQTWSDYNDALKEIIGKKFTMDFSRFEAAEVDLADKIGAMKPTP